MGASSPLSCLPLSPASPVLTAPSPSPPGMPSSGQIEQINRRAKMQNEERRAYQEKEAQCVSVCFFSGTVGCELTALAITTQACKRRVPVPHLGGARPLGSSLSSDCFPIHPPSLCLACCAVVPPLVQRQCRPCCRFATSQTLSSLSLAALPTVTVTHACLFQLSTVLVGTPLRLSSTGRQSTPTRLRP